MTSTIGDISDVGVYRDASGSTVYIQFTEPFELTYGGESLWSPVKQERTVRVTGLILRALGDGEDYIGELQVCFDPRDWDTDGRRKGPMEKPDGLIYTDVDFERDVNELLGYLGFLDTPNEEVVGSEQGMQGEEYVSMDIDSKATKRILDWAEKAEAPA